MKRLIRLNYLYCLGSAIRSCSLTKNSQRTFIFAILFIGESILILANGQTVVYEYDANGNVTSRKVTQALNVANLVVKQDTVSSFVNFLACYSPFKAVSFSELASSTHEANSVKTSNEMNGKSPKDIDTVASSLSSGIERNPFVGDKKKDRISN